MWICDAGQLYDSISDNWCGIGIANVSEILEFVKYAPTIDPETMPIVRELREKLERVTAERNAAVEELRGDCEKCAHYRVTWNGCTPDYECPLSDRCLNRDMWEWRGPQKEE